MHFFCFYKYFLLVYPIKLLDPEQSPMLMDLTKYIEKTWITISVWPVHSWSVFMRPTRTNNDVEGWHHRLNKDKKAGSGNKGLYTIAPLLIEEANLLPIQIQLVSEGKLKKLQRRHVRTTQRLLFNQWEQYVEGSISVGRLLRLCGRLVYGYQISKLLHCIVFVFVDLLVVKCKMYP